MKKFEKKNRLMELKMVSSERVIRTIRLEKGKKLEIQEEMSCLMGHVLIVASFENFG